MNWLPTWATTSGEVIKTSFIAAVTANGVSYSTTRVSVAMSVESPNWLPLMSRHGHTQVGAASTQLVSRNGTSFTQSRRDAVQLPFADQAFDLS